MCQSGTHLSNSPVRQTVLLASVFKMRRQAQIEKHWTAVVLQLEYGQAGLGQSLASACSSPCLGEVTQWDSAHVTHGPWGKWSGWQEINPHPTSSWARLPGLEPWLRHSLTGWTRASCLHSLCLSFCMCEMGVITPLSHRADSRIKWVNIH